MSFSDKHTANHQETILQIKRKYTNKQAKNHEQHTKQTPLNDKKLSSKEAYYQSPSKYLNSIGQSSIKQINNESRVNQETNLCMKDYMTMKNQHAYRQKSQNTFNSSLQIKFKQNNFGNQPIQNRAIKRQFSKIYKVDNLGSEAYDVAHKWSQQRNAKIKELKQVQRYRAIQGLDLKQKNHKVIDEIEQMVMRIKNSLKERNF